MTHARTKHYKVTYSDGSHVLEPFNEAQANEHGTILETDGIALDAAIRMTDKWNAQARLQGNIVRYSIPFVSKARTEFATMHEAQFRVTLQCTRRISPHRLASAIQVALNAALDADIPGTECLVGTILDKIDVKPVDAPMATKSSDGISPGS